MGDKIHKLSDAILLGAKQHRKCTGFFYWDRGDGVGMTCAIGAALVGLGRLRLVPKDWTNPSVYPIKGGQCAHFDTDSLPVKQFLYKRFPNLPVGIINDVFNNNDHRGWSRQRIARWLKTKGH